VCLVDLVTWYLLLLVRFIQAASSVVLALFSLNEIMYELRAYVKSYPYIISALVLDMPYTSRLK
jgi:hypothetical protein